MFVKGDVRKPRCYCTVIVGSERQERKCGKEMKHDRDSFRESGRGGLSGELIFQWRLDGGREKAMHVTGKRADSAEWTQNRPDAKSSGASGQLERSSSGGAMGRPGFQL